MRTRCLVRQVLRREMIFRRLVIRVFVALLVTTSFAQEKTQTTGQPEPTVNTQLPVNWLYGAYIPKNAPLVG